MSTCTPDQIEDALAYLRRSFTCYDLDFQAEKSLKRTFAKYTPGEVLGAIEELKSHSEHWPVAASIETAIRRQRGLGPKGGRVRRHGPLSNQDFNDAGQIVTIPAEEFTPCTEVARHVADVREKMSARTAVGE